MEEVHQKFFSLKGWEGLLLNYLKSLPCQFEYYCTLLSED